MSEESREDFLAGGQLNRLAGLFYKMSLEKGFYDDWQYIMRDGVAVRASPAKFIIPIKLMLVVTEISEAVEAHRCEEPLHLSEELADTFIRLLDLVGFLGIDIESAIADKMVYNGERGYKHGKNY